MWWFGTTCAGCGTRLAMRTDEGFCAGCAPALESAERWLSVTTLPVAAGWAYTGPLQAWIGRCKQGIFSDPQFLLPPVHRLLRQLTQTGAVTLVAIPPERTRLRARGMHLPDVLVDQLRGRNAKRGWLLERLDRAPVRRERMRTPPVLRARASGELPPVVLVDDVVTTGQTLTTALEALRQVGQPVRAAICLADARPQILAEILSQGTR